MRLVNHWNRLHREVVAAPSLGTFTVKLDTALSNLIYFQLSLFMAWVLELDDL